MYKIKPVTKYLIDIFHGDGWSNCARIRKLKDGSLTILKTWGNMPKGFLSQVKL